MTRLERLAALRALTALMRQRDAARLAALRGRETAARAALRDWTRAAAYAPAADEPTPPAAVAAWQGHAARRRRDLAQQTRQLAPQIAGATDALGRSFGRQQALDGVIEREEKRARRSRYRS